jgi:hypothetical protein
MRGILLNCPAAQCSIYESGLMFARALGDFAGAELEYAEIASFEDIPQGYDFYLFNYHHITMDWLDPDRVRELPGKKMTFVLEMLPGDPFPYCPQVFDAYLVPDPTMVLPDPRVFAFPRPLEVVRGIPDYEPRDVPVIGSFGFATPGKGFATLVEAVSREFEKAVIRLRIPHGTHADPQGSIAASTLGECQRLLRPGLELEIEREYLDKASLVAWCAENTLNAFLYHRNQPGLAATTDQAISAGRPLVVSPCETFRHIHEYIPPYPRISLREAIQGSLPAVQRMAETWHADRFRERFGDVLSYLGLANVPSS